MKKRILFTFLGIGCLFSPTYLFCTSCKSDDIVPKEYSDFISDRTFSICGIGVDNQGRNSWVRGTAWIINKKITLDSDYEYYIATNWHVKCGFDEIKPISIRYCDSSQLNYFADPNRYSQFNSITQYGSDCVYNEIGGNKYGIDLYIYDADFGNNQKYKNKLDKLNQYYYGNGAHINTFACDYQSSDCYYIGGYPVGDKQNASAKWETHKISSSRFEKKQSGYSHGVDGDDKEKQATIYDISPQYLFPNVSMSWMASGASGSMVINTQKQICGIYWGGFEMKGGGSVKNFLPCASIMNTTGTKFIPEAIQ